MIDIKFLRENPDIVKENIKKKFQDKKLPLVDEVISLDRISFANLTYDGLKQGEYRELTEEEIKYLLDLAHL